MSSAKELVKFRADPTLRRAIKFRAALADSTLQDVIVKVLRDGLAKEIREVEEREAASDECPESPETPRGRKKNRRAE